MDRKIFIPDDFIKACDKHWTSRRRADRKAELTACFDVEKNAEAAELIRTLEASTDKDACNRAAQRLRAMAADAIAALQNAVQSADLMAGVGIDVTALREQLKSAILMAEYVRDRVAAPWIDAEDIQRAVNEIGVNPGDILLVHSSYTKLGHVIGGPQAVVDGLIAAVGAEGTVVMPTLSQKNFERAYIEWRMDRPSDTGFLTEFFRRQPNAVRSNQQTHSVAAIGKRAVELTCEHTAYGPRTCLFGDYAFSHSSPWQKMHDLGGKVLFLGTITATNTFKHFIECCQVERRLDAVKSPELRQELLDGLWKYEEYDRVVAGDPGKACPMYPSMAVTNVLDAEGFVRHGQVGDAPLQLIDIQTMVREITRILESDLARWYNEPEVAWFKKADSYAGK